MNLVIRTATLPEAAVLAAIERESFGRPHWSVEDFRRYDSLVADTGGQIVGFLVSRQTWASLNGLPAEREILNLAVLPSHRRMGVASALLDRELSRYATFFLEVRESNTAAQELYRRFGFTEIDRRPNYYQSPSEPAIVMRMKRR